MQKFTVCWTNKQGRNYFEVFKNSDSTENRKSAEALYKSLSESVTIQAVYICELLATNIKK